ncbi:ABC transporter ATP-binding protein [Sedimentisphaera salicampi]|uniref:Trehalose import ATP-binding protein SugC n=1 Tax=Sedimentisphaera salicampi TaxID=1941349 RepID=A0A1W6LK77_9BACT|nr:sn-glycerol-3-phosphate ABC transporter ATP-binding protein UgpC [Sedimentisphaera salicampi]ARN56156.1 Trehalose import ATP-binding protein SugC [Sedimentisphaera salicampi]OXU15734.1 Trehalose import ATP-binding protein SugC [Sedimentisphaera salicampi]
MSRVLLENIVKVYQGGFEAVKDACLDIADREFVVIVGPSGCGKTTTLRMIAGLEEITSGQISIGDRIVNDIAPKNRDIAMVFQNYALYPHMTVFDNMAFGLKLRKNSKAEVASRVKDAAEILGIEKLLKRKPKALSGGQRQRVALGRAIVRKPKAFLYDEPLSNLDAKLRVTMRTELKSLHQRLETTSIYVTHDQAEAMTLGDRICVMHEGIIQQVDQPMEVYNRPVNRFVAGFLGTPHMNFVEGKIETVGNSVFFNFSAGKIELPARMNECLNAKNGRDVVFGFRAENVSIASKDDKKSSINAKVEVVEPLGDRLNVYFNIKCMTSEKWLVANLDPHVRLTPGQTLRFKLNMDKTHVFDKGDTGKNLTLQERAEM